MHGEGVVGVDEERQSLLLGDPGEVEPGQGVHVPRQVRLRAQVHSRVVYLESKGGEQGKGGRASGSSRGNEGSWAGSVEAVGGGYWHTMLLTSTRETCRTHHVGLCSVDEAFRYNPGRGVDSIDEGCSCFSSVQFREGRG